MKLPRFVQHIQEQPQGQISYYIQTVNGARWTIGRLLTAYFAAERAERGWWTLTHLPSGRCIPGAGRATLGAAHALAKELEALTDWSEVRKGSRKLAERVRAITGTQLRRVG